MNRAELIARCVPIIEAVGTGKPVEDSFVELKSALPEDAKAARRIAGMANAAHGENIIWLIGIDEKTGEISGSKKHELANWYPRLSKLFDGDSPRLFLVENIQVSRKIVVAMVFESSDAPYVVKTDNDLRDVPWREGNRTVSAHRADLVRMLAPTDVVPAPQVDLVSAGFLAARDSGNRPVLAADLYVKPASDKMVVFPRHDCSVSITLAHSSSVPVMAKTVWLIESKLKGGTVPADMSFPRPGACVLYACFDPSFEMNGEEATVLIKLPPVNAAKPVCITHNLNLRAIGEEQSGPRAKVGFMRLSEFRR